MKKINNYIIEKLKLSKDSKPELTWDDIAKLKDACDDFVYYHTFFRGTNFKVITDTENNTVTILFRKYIHPKELEKFRDNLAKVAKDTLKRTIIVDADSTDNTLTCRYSADESIDEKLKLNKSSKMEERIPPRLNDTIIVLLKARDGRRLLTFGHISSLRKNKENKLEEFQVEYSNEYSERRKDWFFYINDEGNNFIGVSEIPQASVYSCDFALEELNRMLDEKDNKFDNRKLGYSDNDIEEILTYMRNSIKQNLKK